MGITAVYLIMGFAYIRSAVNKITKITKLQRLHKLQKLQNMNYAIYINNNINISNCLKRFKQIQTFPNKSNAFWHCWSIVYNKLLF